MLKLGFAERWVHLLMTCVRSMSYAILINGKPHGKIVPTQGLRQGYPLSPYLFILCAEALSSMLHNAEVVGDLTGIPITQGGGGTQINHFFFAYDSLLFCQANLREWGNIHSILWNYEEAFGQQLNQQKTSLFFNWNTPSVNQVSITSATGVNSTNRYENYLGLPALVGRSRISTFNGIKGRIWNRINGWKEKFLTRAGKEVLIKVVLQAIPTYSMSIFQLPKSLVRDINTMLNQFWWGFKDNTHMIAWMSWKDIGKHKTLGGLGYRELESFNLALLAKQAWRIVKFPDSLVAKVFQEKYFASGSFLDSQLGNRPSFARKSLWQSRKLLLEGLLWRVGNGANVRILGDRWINSTPTHMIQDTVQILPITAKVEELINL
jgi:hypothetical protein